MASDTAGAPRISDASGAIADLGVLVPLSASLIVVNGLDPSAVFLAAGVLVIASGAYFRIPFPVQPLKALTAVAVAQQLAPGVIHAAGLQIAAFLLLLSIGGVANVISRLFAKPIVRGLQLGVGLLLVSSAWRLVAKPPDVFSGSPPAPWPVVLALLAFGAVWLSARTQRYTLALVMFVAGVAMTWVAAGTHLGVPSVTLPRIALPAASDHVAAFLLLVVPQLPLTFGNAVVAVTDVARNEFGPRAGRVTPARVCLSCGAGNVVSAVIGGMPMCHGAGGLTAHVRLGATTMWMNVGLGSALLVLGVFLSPQITVLLGILPVWVLGAFLAYAGWRHAWLVSDLRGAELAVAVIAGAAGAIAGNLALTLGIGLLWELASRVRARTIRSAGVA